MLLDFNDLTGTGISKLPKKLSFKASIISPTSRISSMGHPSNYNLAPMLLDFSDRTGKAVGAVSKHFL